MLSVDKISYSRELIIGQGAFGIVFQGFLEGTKPVAVKRIQKSYTSDDELVTREINAMLVADHPNILRILCYEKNDDFIFIATELCAGTLRDLVEGIYQGPTFEDERDILRQLTIGLAYLHNLGFVHRDIKPTNILIFLLDKYSETARPQIKLAGFGLCRNPKTNKIDFTNTNLSRPSGSEGWIAPELYQFVRYGKKVDIFPLGCIFGYVLSGGKHPFGDHPIKRSFMIMEKRPIQMKAEDLKEPHSNSSVALDLIQSMVDMDPERRPTAGQILDHPFFSTIGMNQQGPIETLQGNTELNELQETTADRWRYGSTQIINGDRNVPFSSSRGMSKVSQSLIYDPRLLIGRGAFSNVYLGQFKGTSVAVKRFQKNDTGDDSIIEREARILKDLEHTHVLRYISMEKNEDFLFIVTELGDATLQDVVEGLYSGPPLVKDEKEILEQVSKGLEYLHNKDIVHRDIKPTNILAFAMKNGETQFKLADFGLSKVVNRAKEIETEGITNSNPNSPKGTRGWMAPELYNSARYDFKVDIFPLGCVFAYTLTRGQHPFGNDQYERMLRIKNREPMLLVQGDLKKTSCHDRLAFALIRAMVNMDPAARPHVNDILNHEFFLRSKRKFDGARSTMFFNICRLNLFESMESTGKLLFELAMDQSVDVNSDTVDGWTPLHFLCQFYKWENLAELVNLLVKRNVEVNARTTQGWTPLHLLCKHYKHSNMIQIIQLLIERGADINAKNLDEESNAFHLLCQYYQSDDLIDIVGLLIVNGADVNAKAAFGFTPLHFLCENYKNENLSGIVSLLIQNGADINAKTLLKWNPLHFLCQNYKCDNLFDIVCLLIENGIYIDAKTSLGWNPLHFLCYYFKKDNIGPILLLLLRKGIDVNARTSLGWNALHFLCQRYKYENLIELVRILIEYEIDINAKTFDDGSNPLQLLCKYYQNDNLIDIIHLMLENGIDYDAENDKGLTASYILNCRASSDNKFGRVLEILGVKKQTFSTFLFRKVKNRK